MRFGMAFAAASIRKSAETSLSQLSPTSAPIRRHVPPSCAGRDWPTDVLDIARSEPHNSNRMGDSSFDIVSEVNLQVLDNAITQAQKEIGTRYDFKGTAASVEFNRKDKELTLTADVEQHL